MVLERIRQTLRRVLIAIVLILAFMVLFARDLLFFILGTSIGLLFLNLFVYIGTAIASFLMGYIISRILASRNMGLLDVTKKILGIFGRNRNS